MTAAGLDPLRVLDARRPPESIRAWLELHVEQGPVLVAPAFDHSVSHGETIVRQGGSMIHTV
jgi:hypothetical protein